MKFKSLNGKYIGIPLFVILCIWLSMLPSASCDFPVNEVTDNPQALQQYGLSDNLDLLSDYLAQADNDCKKLEDFKWQGLDDLGYREIQEAGQCCQTPRLYDKNDDTDIYSTSAVWMPILGWLPDNRRISPLRRLIDSSRNTLSAIITEVNSFDVDGSTKFNSLSESETVNNLFTNLDAALKSAVYVATSIDKTSNFNEVSTLLEEADSATQYRYRDKFIEQSGKYLELLNILKADLEKSAAVAVNLKIKIAEPGSDL